VLNGRALKLLKSLLVLLIRGKNKKSALQVSKLPLVLHAKSTHQVDGKSEILHPEWES